MKRFIFILSMILCFSLLTLCVSAEEQNMESLDTSEVILENSEGEGINLKGYIGEKIIPTLFGVVTGLIGLIGSVKIVKRAVGSLVSSSGVLLDASSRNKEEFDKEKKEIKLQLDRIKNEACEISQARDLIDELKRELSVVIKESHNMSRMIALTTLGDENAIKDGRGAMVYKLLEKSSQMLNQLGIETDEYERILEKSEVDEGEKA
ncbi:MAG: hypothetical protein IJW54_04650 [Clostridia bacterium]|nr:hypothetical protein [Clostridia bacterium]